MVISKHDLDILPPAERIKKLKEIEILRKTELKDGEDKLKELQLQKMREIVEAKSELAKTMDELELDAKRENESREKESRSLDILLSEGFLNPNKMSDLVSLPISMNDFNGDFYNELKGIEKKFESNEYVSLEEQRKVMLLKEQSNIIINGYNRHDVDAFDKQNNDYVRRSEETLKQLDNHLHNLQEEGVYNLNKLVGDRAIYK